MNIQDAITLEEYLKIDKAARTGLGGWVIYPYGLIGGEWKLFYNYLKENHPVQYFIRETLGDVIRYANYRFQNWKYRVACYFFPKNQYLRKVIPKAWTNKSYLIQEVLFAIIVDYVEQEKGLKAINWNSNADSRKIGKEIRAIYNYITKGRPAILKQHDELISGPGYWDDRDDRYGRGFNPSKLMKQSWKLDGKREKLDQEYCERIVKIKNML